MKIPDCHCLVKQWYMTELLQTEPVHLRLRSQNFIDNMSNSDILLVNLGSPESPTTKDLKPYLEEFLMDERVIDIPKWLRALIVKGLIVPFRSPKSAAKYKTCL